MTHDVIYFTTNHGEAFTGTVCQKNIKTSPQPIKNDKMEDTDKSALAKFLETEYNRPFVKITKIPNIHRAVSIAVDCEGLNYACLQVRCFF